MADQGWTQEAPSREKAVAHAMHRQEVPRSLRVRLQLLAQPDDVGIYRAGVGKGLMPPHRVQDDVARERAARILEEERQQVELRARQPDLIGRTSHHALVQVYLDIGK